MGVDALNELNDYVYFRAGQPTVIWYGLGLLRAAPGRWTRLLYHTGAFANEDGGEIGG